MGRDNGQKEKGLKQKQIAEKAIHRKEQRKQIAKERREGPPKICTLCKKPHYARTHLCGGCNKRFKQMRKQNKGVSIVKLVAIQKKFPEEDIWQVIQDGRANPTAPLRKQRPQMMDYKRKRREEYRSASYHRAFYNKEDKENIPLFIYHEMERYPSRELVGISGKRTNPYVYYICLQCGEEQAVKYTNLNHGHDCIAAKSTGEAIVEAYLKELNISFLTQRRTLPCVNPRTQSVLPYDIEIRQKKLLIEIQGDQHYRYIPHFHGTEENFQYQQWKDSYKKKYAEYMGYQLLYIDYPAINTRNYIAQINEALQK